MGCERYGTIPMLLCKVRVVGARINRKEVVVGARKNRSEKLKEDR